VGYKDKDILSAIRNGNDHKALEALYKSLLPKIKKIVNASYDKEEECKDILQEALLIFYKQVMSNKFDDKYEIGGFIYTIAKNLWINRVKVKNRFVHVEDGSIPEGADTNALDNMELKERNKIVEELFAMLDDKCKQLLTYTIFDDLSMKEIAEKMDFTSANAATVASYRCKKHLIELVKKHKLTKIIK
jgi:RNA polymerase sigma factor (sigma-70 family)